MRTQEWMPRLSRGLLGCGVVAVALAAPGCKTLNERYIALEVWKYEKCFGHLPPGFVPPGVAAAAPAAPPRVCGQGAPCATAAPCAGAESIASDGCNSCGGATMEGGLPAGTTIVPGSSTIHSGGTVIPGGSLPAGTTIPGGAGAPMLPAGPGGAPGPVTGASVSVPTLATPVSASRPVVISDEVVLP